MKFAKKELPAAFLLLTLIVSAALAITVLPQPVSAQTAPSIVINGGAQYTNSTDIVLTLFSSNATNMRFSNDNATWSDWQTYATTENWTLPSGDDTRTVYSEFQDSDNATIPVSSSIILDQTPPDPQPYADWYGDYRTVIFDASYSTDNFGIANYTWNFGDGNITIGKTVIHVYANAGNYTVKLTVQDFAGNNATVDFPALIPELSDIATPAPTVAPTVHPTVYPTLPPITTPTPTPEPETIDTTWLVIVAIVVVVVVLGVIVAFMLMRGKKSAPKTEQNQQPSQPKPPQQPPRPQQPNEQPHFF